MIKNCAHMVNCCMAEKQEEKRSDGEVAPSQRPYQNDTYFSYTRQLQNEGTESVELEEKQGEIENKFNELLKAIGEESLQLSEFLLEERKLANELCSLLTQILRRLNISFSIRPEYIDGLGTPKQVKLNTEGHLIIIRDGDKVDSKLLQDYPPDIVLTVMWVIIPELEKAIKGYRKKISRRVNLMEKIKRELKNIQKAFTPGEKQGLEQIPEEGITRPLIESRE